MFSALTNEFKKPRVISGKELPYGALVSTLVGMSRYYFRHGNARSGGTQRVLEEVLAARRFSPYRDLFSS